MTPPEVTSTQPTAVAPQRFVFDRHELAGAVADLGVLVPIAVALVVRNGMSPTAVLLPAGLLYVATAFRYRLPVPVQPLKAFGAIAVAQGLGVDVIAAGALLMGVLFLALGATGLIDRVAAWFPLAVIRGVQISVGLLFLKIAWGLVVDPPSTFLDADRPTALLAAGTALALLVLWLGRRHGGALLLVAVAAVVMVVTVPGSVARGPSAITFPTLTWDAFATAAVVLVLPQAALSFANSCLGTADAAREYFGTAAAKVTPGRLAVSLGLANLVAGSMSGMPVCHGAGGLTAHRTFGARTGGAPLAMGVALISTALLVGAGLVTLLSAFPLAILAALLAAAGALHMSLARDLLHRPGDLAVAVGVGVLGFFGNLGLALLLGLAVMGLRSAVARRRVTR